MHTKRKLPYTEQLNGVCRPSLSFNKKMEAEGIVSPANHVGRREVLVGKDN